MSIKKFLAIFAVSILLSATAFAEGWKPPVADHEARITTLESKPSGMQLYDAEGTLVGLFIQQLSFFGGPLIFIPDPDLNAFTVIRCFPPSPLVNGDTWDGQIVSGTFSYESEDGSGTPYLTLQSISPFGFAINFLVYDSCNDKYYLSNNTLTTITQRSSRPLTQCEAAKEGTPEPYSVYEIVEISEDDIPLALPIPCPLSFQPSIE